MTDPIYMRRVCNGCGCVGEFKRVSERMIACANCGNHQGDSDGVPRRPVPTDPKARRLAQQGAGSAQQPTAAPGGHDAAPMLPRNEREHCDRETGPREGNGHALPPLCPHCGDTSRDHQHCALLADARPSKAAAPPDTGAGMARGNTEHARRYGTALDHLRSFAEAREPSHFLIRDGLTYADVRETLEGIAVIEKERDAARAELVRANERIKSWQVAWRTLAEKCETCEGSGIMDACSGYDPNGGDIYEPEPCGECAGTGKGHVANAIKAAVSSALGAGPRERD